MIEATDAGGVATERLRALRTCRALSSEVRYDVFEERRKYWNQSRLVWVLRVRGIHFNQPNATPRLTELLDLLCRARVVLRHVDDQDVVGILEREIRRHHIVIPYDILETGGIRKSVAFEEDSIRFPTSLFPDARRRRQRRNAHR